MQSIYSSKLYIASSRKARIKAALVSKGNLALVQQLATDLDDEYKTPENLGKEPKVDNQVNEQSDNLMVNEKIDPEKDLMTINDLKTNRSSNRRSGSSMPSGGSKSEPSDDFDKEDNELGDTSELMPESPANEQQTSDKEPAEASTKIVSTTIIKPEQLVNIEVLKGSLNAREDLAGVLRVLVKEKEQEIWIYYNDNINLNNIMVDVIEFVKNAGFDVLEFNRLARSDNAIVFSISFQTARELKSISSDENK